jgi:hypothetical protein
MYNRWVKTTEETKFTYVISVCLTDPDKEMDTLLAQPTMVTKHITEFVVLIPTSSKRTSQYGTDKKNCK